MLKIILLCISFLISFAAQANKRISNKRYQILSGLREGGRRSIINQDPKKVYDQFKWNPSSFLFKNYYYLLPYSKVLDLSLGDGNNSVFLAKKGFKVSILEKDLKRIGKAKLLAKEFGVRLNEFHGSVKEFNFPLNSFDAIIVFKNLDKKYYDKILKWLKPGGILFYEGHTIRQKGQNPEVITKNLIKPHELLNYFRKYRVLKYQEPLHLENYSASIIIKKPSITSF